MPHCLMNYILVQCVLNTILTDDCKTQCCCCHNVYTLCMYVCAFMLVDPPIPQLIQFAMRDTAVLLKLHPSLLASGVVSCLVELVSPASGLNTTSFLNHTMSDLDGGLCLFIEGLVPNQEYSLRLAAINEAGVSGFTEWVNFTTTSAGE